MAVFSKRLPGYQVGLIGLLVFSFVYLLAYTTPCWITASQFGSEATLGLWQLCYGDICSHIGLRELRAMFHICRILETTGLLILLLTCIYGAVSNFCLPEPTYTRSLEKYGSVGGLLSFVGAMFFVGTFRDFGLVQPRLDWSFYLAVAGSLGGLFASLFIAFSNREILIVPSRHRTGVDTGVWVSQSQPPGLLQSHVQGGKGLATPIAPSVNLPYMIY